MLKATWNNEGAAASVADLQCKLLNVSWRLLSWGITSFGHVRRELRKLQADLKTL